MHSDGEVLVGEFVGAGFERVVRVKDAVEGGGRRGDFARGLLFGFFGGLEGLRFAGGFFAFAVLRVDVVFVFAARGQARERLRVRGDGLAAEAFQQSGVHGTVFSETDEMP